MRMAIGLGKLSGQASMGSIAMLMALTLSGCGRYSFNEKEQHLYETAARIKAYTANPASKSALIQSKYSAQMMDKSMGMFDKLRAESQQQKALLESQSSLLSQAAKTDGSGPAAQQIASQYPSPSATLGTAGDGPTAGDPSAAQAAAQARLQAMRAAQLQQLQSMREQFNPSGMQAKMQEAMSKDMTPSDVARALAEQDKTIRGMTSTMAKIPEQSGASKTILSLTDGMINQAMPTHIYYVTPETPWSIAVSGDDSGHKVICKGFGDDLTTPKFTDEYDMTWK